MYGHTIKKVESNGYGTNVSHTNKISQHKMLHYQDLPENMQIFSFSFPGQHDAGVLVNNVSFKTSERKKSTAVLSVATKTRVRMGPNPGF